MLYTTVFFLTLLVSPSCDRGTSCVTNCEWSMTRNYVTPITRFPIRVFRCFRERGSCGAVRLQKCLYKLISKFVTAAGESEANLSG